VESEFSVDDGLDELIFALGAQNEEEIDYIEQRFDEFYKEHVGYELCSMLDSDSYTESSKEEFLDDIVDSVASGLASGLAESLKTGENILDEFYSMNIEERFDYLVFINEDYAVGESPDSSLEQRFGSSP